MSAWNTTSVIFFRFFAPLFGGEKIHRKIQIFFSRARKSWLVCYLVHSLVLSNSTLLNFFRFFKMVDHTSIYENNFLPPVFLCVTIQFNSQYKNTFSLLTFRLPQFISIHHRCCPPCRYFLRIFQNFGRKKMKTNFTLLVIASPVPRIRD